jgi:hypothetical protein
MKDAAARWLACTEPRDMLRGSDRKLRLFAVECCRRLERLLHQRSRQAVEAAERFAEGELDGDELERARIAAVYDPHGTTARALANNAAMYAALPSARAAAYAVCEVSFAADQKAGRGWQCDLLREIIGNPHQPVTIDRAWLARNDRAVLKLARAIYDERDFADLGVLADALEDAGCRDERLLDHCREPGEHVHGCWALDCVLARE